MWDSLHSKTHPLFCNMVMAQVATSTCNSMSPSRDISFSVIKWPWVWRVMSTLNFWRECKLTHDAQSSNSTNCHILPCYSVKTLHPATILETITSASARERSLSSGPSLHPSRARCGQVTVRSRRGRVEGAGGKGRTQSLLERGGE